MLRARRSANCLSQERTKVGSTGVRNDAFARVSSWPFRCEVPDNGVIKTSNLCKLTSAGSEIKLIHRRDWQPHALCSSASRPRERVETTSHRRSCGAQTSCCVAEHLKSCRVADLSGIGTHMPFKPIDTFSRSGYAQAPCLLQLLTPNSSPSSPLRHRQMSTKAVRLQTAWADSSHMGAQGQLGHCCCFCRHPATMTCSRLSKRSCPRCQVGAAKLC